MMIFSVHSEDLPSRDFTRNVYLPGGMLAYDATRLLSLACHCSSYPSRIYVNAVLLLVKSSAENSMENIFWLCLSTISFAYLGDILEIGGSKLYRLRF